ncbi:hypothetical protein JCM5353_000858 [Sporobolomyces roseus]
MGRGNNKSGGGKRGGKSGGDKAGGGGGGQHKAHIYASKRPVGGKGIFVTCVRGKESRAVGEMYDLLEEVADRLYPKERVEAMIEQRRKDLEVKAKARETSAMDQDEEQTEVDAPQPVLAVVEDDTEDDEDDDIEASIEKELAALKSGRGGSQSKVKKDAAGGGGGDKGKGKAKERPRFMNIETGTECLCFIATAWPYDPVELVEALVSEVQETGQSRTRYVQRLSPTVVTCHSNSMEIIESQSSRLIEQTFTNWSIANNKTSITYQIEPSLRSHTAPLSRGLLLPLLGSLVSRLSSAPTLSSPCPQRPLLQVKADLKNPDLVLLPTVLKNCYALSIVEGRLWKGKKFNLEQIAMETRRRKGIEEDEIKEKEKEKENSDKKEQEETVEIKE